MNVQLRNEECTKLSLICNRSWRLIKITKSYWQEFCHILTKLKTSETVPNHIQAICKLDEVLVVNSKMRCRNCNFFLKIWMNGCKLHLPVNSISCTINRLYPAQDKSCCQTVICNLQILFIPICVLFMIERACSRASWDKISLTICWAILCKFHNHSILIFWKLIHPLKGVQPLRAADYGNDAEIKLLFIAGISAQVSSSGFNSALDEAVCCHI